MIRILLSILFVLSFYSESFAQRVTSPPQRIRFGTTLPSTCTNGMLFQDTDATAGQQIYACESGAWVLQGDGGSGSVSDTAYAASWDGVTTTAPSKNAVYDKIETIASGGDNITVNTTAATNANFLDNLYIDWAIDTAATPDDITSKFNYAETLAGNPALLVDECVLFKDATGGGLLCEGSTADTNEQIYRVPDLNGADTDQDIVLDDETQTLTNKTMAAASNVLDADTAVALAADPADCATSTHFAVGVIASGVATCEAIGDADIPDSTTVTGWVLGTSSATQLTSPTVIVDLLDASGAVDMDYGSADVTDHTFIADGTTDADFVVPDNSIGVNEIGDDAILEVMLKAVDAAADEECLTFESTTGDFEWQTCGGGGAPTDADYLVGTANGSLSAEIVVGTTPGGELGGTWGTPTIDDGVTVDTWTLSSPTFTTAITATNLIVDAHLATTESINLPIYSAKLTGAFVVFTPPTADACTQGAQIDAGDGNWRLLFDPTTDECATWQFVLPDYWAAHSELKIFYTMTSATANEVDFEAAVMCVTPGDAADIGTAGFANVATASDTVPGTVGYLDSVSITVTDDSCAAGDVMFVVISKDANDATLDDATGDTEVVGVVYEFTR